MGTLSTNSINGNNSNSLTRIQSSRNSNATARLELAVDTTGGRIGDIIVSQYSAYFKNLTRSATLLDASGNTSFPGTVTSTNLKADNETRLAAVEAEVDTKADIEHTHTCSDITDLEERLSSITFDTNHTHTVFDNDVTFNGSINGLSIRNTNVGPCENTIPCVRSDGCMEVGKYIDFHDTNSTTDYDVRLTATSGSTSSNGTLTIGANISSFDIGIYSSYPTINFGAGAQKNDYARIRFSGGNNAGNLEIATADDANEPIYVRQYSGTFTTAKRTATLLDGSGNTSFPGIVSSPQVNTNSIYLGSSLGLGDYGRILFGGSKENGYMEIATSDDYNEPIYVRQYKYTGSNNWSSVGHQITLMDANGNQTFNNITATNIKNEFPKATFQLSNVTITTSLNSSQYTKTISYNGLSANVVLNFTGFFSTSGAVMAINIPGFNECNVELTLRNTYTFTRSNNDISYFNAVPTWNKGTLTLSTDFTELHSLNPYTIELNLLCMTTGKDTNYSMAIKYDFNGTMHTSEILSNTIPTNNYLVDWLYPVGSIYMSMNNIDPSNLFGGTWTQIKDRFLLCSSSSKRTGGSTTIQTNQLFSATTSSNGGHNHSIRSEYDDFNFNIGSSFKSTTLSSNVNSIPMDTGGIANTGAPSRYTYTESVNSHTHTISGTTGARGDGGAYWQPYITCYCWYRTA